MTPGSYSLEIYRGDSYHWQFRLWTDAERTVPADLTGVVAKAEIRDKAGGATVLATLICTISENLIDVELTPDISGTLPIKGAWDLQLTYPSGEVSTILAGPVTVTLDVTETIPVVASATRVAVLARK